MHGILKTGCHTEFRKADAIFRQLLTFWKKYPDCAVDVTGGSDAALFATGIFDDVISWSSA